MIALLFCRCYFSSGWYR